MIRCHKYHRYYHCFDLTGWSSALAVVVSRSLLKITKRKMFPNATEEYNLTTDFVTTKPTVLLNGEAMDAALMIVTKIVPLVVFCAGVVLIVCSLLALQGDIFKNSASCFYIKVKCYFIDIGSVCFLLQRIVLAMWPNAIGPRAGWFICRQYFVLSRMFVGGLPMVVNILIAYDRFIAVLNPVSCRVTLTMVRAWVSFSVGLLLTFLHAVIGSLYNYVDDGRSFNVFTNCVAMYPTVHRYYLASDLVRMCLTCTILITLNILTSITLRKHQNILLTIQANNLSSRQIPLQMTLMMLVCCWMTSINTLPMLAQALFFHGTEFGRNLRVQPLGEKLWDLCREILYMVAITNNVMNGYIYVFGCRRLRKEFLERLRRLRERRVSHQPVETIRITVLNLFEN